MNFGNSTLATLWHARSRREHTILIALAAVVAGFTCWYGVASPLRRAAASAGAERSRAAQELALVEAAQREIAGEAGLAPLPSGGMEEAVSVSAAASGIALARTRIGGDREITIWASAVDPRAFFGWVLTLRKAHGIVVSNLTAARKEDGTLDVEALLSGGAP
jgi:type II secretory pathway component PulM